MTSPEMRLIIAILNTCFRPDIQEASTRLKEGLSWESFHQKAAGHGLEGLIYHRLKTADLLQSLPPDTCKQLERQYYCNLARNMLLLNELEAIEREFEKRKLSLLVMQGMSILEDIYPALGTRPLNDMDIMIRVEEEHAVRRTLEDLGYRPAQHYPWVYMKGASRLDVHHDPANITRISARRHAFTIAIAELWRDSLPMAGGASRRRFCIEDNLLLLCGHLQKHSFSRLIWFVDLGLMVKLHGEEIDWERLLAKAWRYNLIKPLTLVLGQLGAVFGVEAPAEISRKLSCVRLNPLEKAVLRRLRSGREAGEVGELLFASSLGARRCAAYLLETAFPRREVMAQIYRLPPSSPVWPAYPLRFFHLLQRGVREAARMLMT